MSKIIRTLIALTVICLGLPTFSWAKDISAGFDALDNKDYQTAFQIFQENAKQGNIPATYMVGAMYEDGGGVPQNYAEAEKMYLIASKQGSAKAAFRLGKMYKFGQGVKKNDAAAFDLFSMAAKQELASGLSYLGAMYASGEGVAKDVDRGLSYMKRGFDIAIKKAKSAKEDEKNDYMSPVTIYLQALNSNAVRNKSGMQSCQDAYREAVNAGIMLSTHSEIPFCGHDGNGDVFIASKYYKVLKRSLFASQEPFYDGRCAPDVNSNIVFSPKQKKTSASDIEIDLLLEDTSNSSANLQVAEHTVQIANDIFNECDIKIRKVLLIRSQCNLKELSNSYSGVVPIIFLHSTGETGYEFGLSSGEGIKIFVNEKLSEKIIGETIAHELGHIFGLEHTVTMSPDIMNISEVFYQPHFSKRQCNAMRGSSSLVEGDIFPKYVTESWIMNSSSFPNRITSNPLDDNHRLEVANNGNANAAADAAMSIAFDYLLQSRRTTDDKRSIDYQAEAMKWYQKSAILGLRDSMHSIGVMYESGYGVAVDYDEAMRWYKTAAEKGFGSAMNNIGSMYALGRGVPVDYAKAMHWYQEAVDQGDFDPAPYENMAMLYANGLGVKKDLKTAKYLRDEARRSEKIGKSLGR